MIRQLFKDAGIKVTDQEFKEIMYMTTDDIRENRIKFGKRTNLQQMFTITKRSLKALRQCDTALRFYFDRKVTQWKYCVRHYKGKEKSCVMSIDFIKGL